MNEGDKTKYHRIFNIIKINISLIPSSFPRYIRDGINEKELVQGKVVFLLNFYPNLHVSIRSGKELSN